MGAEYVDAIRAAGGVPLLLPHLDEHEVADVLDVVDGHTRRQVNTIHHQAVDQVAEGFRVTARAPDGVVEGLESTTGWDALGVQWHPEKTVTGDDAPLFTAFVDMVRT